MSRNAVPAKRVPWLGSWTRVANNDPLRRVSEGAGARCGDRTALHSVSRLNISVELFQSFDAAEPVWRKLERDGIGSVYQRYDWCKIWFETLGQLSAATPLIVIVCLDGAPALLLPLCVRKGLFGQRTATFIGDKHANVRMPLMHVDALKTLQARAADETLLHAITDGLRHAGAVDFMALSFMARSFNGNPNMLASADGGSCTHQLLVGPLHGNFQRLVSEKRSASFAKKLRKKRRHLEKHGALSFGVADSLPSLYTALDAFFAQKAVRMDAMRIANPFDRQAHRDFVRALAEHSLTHGSGLLDIYVLRSNDQVLAFLAGGHFNGAFSGAMNSTTMDPTYVAGSPGELINHDLIEHLCGEGFTSFDLGLGTGRYKLAWCDAQDLTTVSAAITPFGRIASAIYASKESLRHLILKRTFTARIARRLKYELKRFAARS